MQDLTVWFTAGQGVGELHDLLAFAVPVVPEERPDRSGGGGVLPRRKFMPALLAKAIMRDVDIVSDPQTGLVYRWEGRFWEQ